MLKADLCDYSDACITVKGLLAAASNENVKAQKNVAFKNNALFRSCISKVNSTLIVNAEDLDIAMPMYNLLEYSQNYSMTSGSLCNYYRDGGKSFNYKTKIVGKTPRIPDIPPQPDPYQDECQPPRPPQPPLPALNAEVTIPLNYLSNLWRFSDLPLKNCEIERNLSWTKDRVMSE